MKPFLLLCLLLPFVPAQAAEPMRIVNDRAVMRTLPRKSLFENIDDKLMRNNAGTELHLGPGEQHEFFIVKGLQQWKQIKAPSTGKAYLGTDGKFAVWYDSLPHGVHFANGKVLHLADPVHTRFGVDYDAVFCYQAQTNKSEVFRTTDPFRPIFRLENVYLYKIMRHDRDILSVGYLRFPGDYKREHRWWRHRDVEGEWMEMAQGALPDALVVVDGDMAHDHLLMMQETAILTRLHEYDLRTGLLRETGEVDWFGFYMNSRFHTGFDPREPRLPPDKSAAPGF